MVCLDFEVLICCVNLGRIIFFFFFSSRRRHTRSLCDWSSDVCSSDLPKILSSAKKKMGEGAQNFDEMLVDLQKERQTVVDRKSVV